MWRLMIVWSFNDRGVTSQVVAFDTPDDAEKAAQRIEKVQNGYSPWTVLRLYDPYDLTKCGDGTYVKRVPY